MAVMSEYKDVVLAFGESDEYRYVLAATMADYSFLIRQGSSLYNRRRKYVFQIRVMNQLTTKQD